MLKTAKKKELDSFLGAHSTQKLIKIHKIQLWNITDNNTSRLNPHTGSPRVPGCKVWKVELHAEVVLQHKWDLIQLHYQGLVVL